MKKAWLLWLLVPCAVGAYLAPWHQSRATMAEDVVNGRGSILTFYKVDPGINPALITNAQTELAHSSAVKCSMVNASGRYVMWLPRGNNCYAGDAPS